MAKNAAGPIRLIAPAAFLLVLRLDLDINGIASD